MAIQIFSEERLVEISVAVRVYLESLPKLQKTEYLKRVGFNRSTVDTWVNGSRRHAGLVPPSPGSLLKLYEITGNEVFIPTLQEAKVLDRLHDPKYDISPVLRALIEQKAHGIVVSERVGAEQKTMVSLPETGSAGSLPDQAVESRGRRKNGSSSSPAYNRERLGELADATEAHYQHAIKTTPKAQQDRVILALKKMNWLRQRPENRGSLVKMNCGPGPELMTELYARTKNAVFLLSKEEVRVFRGRGKPLSPESEAFMTLCDARPVSVSIVESPRRTVFVQRDEPEEGHRVKEFAFSPVRVGEFLRIFAVWIEQLGKATDPPEERREAKAATLLGVPVNEVYLLRIGRKALTLDVLVKIYAACQNERLKPTDDEAAQIVASGLAMPEFCKQEAPVVEVQKAVVSVIPASGNTEPVLAEMNMKLQAVIQVLELLVARSPEMQTMPMAGKSLTEKDVGQLVTRLMVSLKAQFLMLKGLLAVADQVPVDWKSNAVDMVAQLVKSFNLQERDFSNREPTAETNPEVLRRMSTILGPVFGERQGG